VRLDGELFFIFLNFFFSLQLEIGGIWDMRWGDDFFLVFTRKVWNILQVGSQLSTHRKMGSQPKKFENPCFSWWTPDRIFIWKK